MSLVTSISPFKFLVTAHWNCVVFFILNCDIFRPWCIVRADLYKRPVTFPYKTALYFDEYRPVLFVAIDRYNCIGSNSPVWSNPMLQNCSMIDPFFCCCWGGLYIDFVVVQLWKDINLVTAFLFCTSIYTNFCAIFVALKLSSCIVLIYDRFDRYILHSSVSLCDTNPLL